LQHFVLDYRAFRLKLVECFAIRPEACYNKAQDSPACAHCLDIKALLPDVDNFNNQWYAVTVALVMMLDNTHDCIASREALSVFLEWMQRSIGHAIGIGDLRLRLSSNVERMQRLTVTGKRKLRVDEDYKEFVSREKILRGNAISAASSLRESDPVAGESSGRRWEQEVVRNQVAANLLSHMNPEHVSVVTDGKRLGGVPDEDTLSYFAWESRTDCTSVLPPIVFPHLADLPYNKYAGARKCTTP
jgi:hypothetical protein